MIINRNSQLGLRIDHDPLAQKDFFDAMLKEIRNALNTVQSPETTDIDLVPFNKYVAISNRITNITGADVSHILSHVPTKNYYICQSVYHAAELVKVSESFTGRALKDVPLGSHTYLMGKDEMVRMLVVVGGIRGFYLNTKTSTAFEWYIDLITGEYAFRNSHQADFTKIMKLLVFIELGDIEVKILENNRNNGGKKNVDKITNQSNATVYVVDSSWNQILIRTEGFAVRGHFRLQPCGPNNADRKLIWVDAFEKHGYTRKPKGEIRG